jgi:hypothetical protein
VKKEKECEKKRVRERERGYMKESKRERGWRE